MNIRERAYFIAGRVYQHMLININKNSIEWDIAQYGDKDKDYLLAFQVGETIKDMYWRYFNNLSFKIEECPYGYNLHITWE